MKKIYQKIDRLIEKDLNEYIKWVILLGLYVFYRMMENAYDEEKLYFLVIPLIFLAILTFLSDWIIKDLIRSTEKSNQKEAKGFNRPLFVAILFYASIILLLLFYILKWYPLINLGILAVLGSSILARYDELNISKFPTTWLRWYLRILILIGIGGAVHAVFYNNSLNTISFVFYIAGIVYYFLDLYFYKAKKKN